MTESFVFAATELPLDKLLLGKLPIIDILPTLLELGGIREDSIRKWEKK